MRGQGRLEPESPGHTPQATASRRVAAAAVVVAVIMEWSFVMMSKSLVSRLGAPLAVIFLTFVPMFAAVCAAEDPHQVTVVSFGLFGDQGVFRSEANHGTLP
jgi:hypothetical protein